MRWWARLRAWLGGYFWAPCPVCGRPFAGFECTGTLAEQTRERMTCPHCPGEWVRLSDGQVYCPGVRFTSTGELFQIFWLHADAPGD